MDADYYSSAIALLENAAAEFKRSVDKQIVAFENEQKLHEETIRSIDEKIAALQQREKELLEKKSLKDIDVSDKKKEADKITEEINSLKRRERELEEEKEKRQFEFEEKRRRIASQTDELSKERVEGDDSKELTNGLLFYSQRLQMFLNKGSSSFLHLAIDLEGIRITFRCIDRNHPKRRFYVVLKINDEEKWELLRTKPCLENESALMKRLNESNDVNSFLRNVRKSFKAQYCNDV
ncbi:uncharacterized protein [Blastocystis hominis]|uniref:Kinetochore protein SPC25 n=1 Tax=Blastocystis hominis TaxID=12968 RepID=D8MBU7_BLAHO|nr:uncharacterized protein [Blastocystis hominis]CBK25536.2 unnamed protein product [Blastocystis hominis]|eukprot:XP_012899584.1 uncharacterized protein [Blastocystis hominis]